MERAATGSVMLFMGVSGMGKSSVLKSVRSDRKTARSLSPLRGGRQWEGMPLTFEGAAGLSSQVKNFIDCQGDPSVRDNLLKKREEEVLRLASRNAELMSGVLDLEGAPAPASATKRTPPSSGGLVTGFRRNSSFGRRRESGS